MFFPQKMKKLNVLVVKRYTDEVVKEILEFGDFEVIPMTNKSAKMYELHKESLDDMSARFQEYRRRTVSLMQFFGLDVDTIPEKHDDFMDEIVIKSALMEIEGKSTTYSKEVEDVKRRQNDIRIKLDGIRFFSDFDLDKNNIEDVKHFYMGFGSVPETNYKAFEDALSTIPSVVMNVGNIEKQNMVFFTVPKNYQESVDKVLQNVYFKNYGIPKEIGSSIKSTVMRFGFELSLTHDEELYLDKQFRKMKARFETPLSDLINSIDYHISMLKVRSEMGATGSVNLLAGWVPADSVNVLRDRIEDFTNHQCFFLEEEDYVVSMRDGIEPPTKLQNPKIIKPFENLVKMFGTPNYREFNPTLPMAVLYILMFGAMFGDAGHGAIIGLLGLVIMLIKKAKGVKWLGEIMVMVGISSMIFGFLYGGMFGQDFHLIEPLWMSPEQNIMKILLIAVCYGILVISFGMVLSIINSARMHDYGKMLFGSTGIAGIIFYWSLLGFGVMAIMKVQFPHLLFLIPAVMAVLITLEKRLSYVLFHHGEKTPIAMGFVEVFEATLSMLSNSISFIRVGAFALNHGALESAVFILASMAHGPVGKAITLVIGNIFVIVLEGLLVGIQALRLEYYEFFVKFFHADGREFTGFDMYKKQAR